MKKMWGILITLAIVGLIIAIAVAVTVQVTQSADILNSYSSTFRIKSATTNKYLVANSDNNGLYWSSSVSSDSDTTKFYLSIVPVSSTNINDGTNIVLGDSVSINCVNGGSLRQYYYGGSKGTVTSGCVTYASADAYGIYVIADSNGSTSDASNISFGGTYSIKALDSICNTGDYVTTLDDPETTINTLGLQDFDDTADNLFIFEEVVESDS